MSTQRNPILMISEMNFWIHFSTRNASNLDKCYLIDSLITKALQVSRNISDLTVFAHDWKHVLINLPRDHCWNRYCSRGVY